MGSRDVVFDVVACPSPFAGRGCFARRLRVGDFCRLVILAAIHSVLGIVGLLHFFCIGEIKPHQLTRQITEFGVLGLLSECQALRPWARLTPFGPPAVTEFVIIHKAAPPTWWSPWRNFVKPPPWGGVGG